MLTKQLKEATERLAECEGELGALMAAQGADHKKLAELQAEHTRLVSDAARAEARYVLKFGSF